MKEIRGKDLKKGIDYYLTGDFFGYFGEKVTVKIIGNEFVILVNEGGLRFAVSKKQRIFLGDPKK